MLQERFTNAYNALRSAGIVHTQGDFAKLIGANQATISRAFSGDPKYLTENLVSRVESAVSGIGTRPTQQSGETLPVLPIGAMAGTIQDWADAIHEYDCERIVSPIRGASLAAQVTGDSMSPEYPSGSQIIVKKVDPSAFVQWGEVYLLDTDNGPILKQVRQTDRADVVECVSLNPAYQPFRVACEYIRGWYRVLMCLTLK